MLNCLRRFVDQSWHSRWIGLGQGLAVKLAPALVKYACHGIISFAGFTDLKNPAWQKWRPNTRSMLGHHCGHGIRVCSEGRKYERSRRGKIDLMRRRNQISRVQRRLCRERERR